MTALMQVQAEVALNARVFGPTKENRISTLIYNMQHDTQGKSDAPRVLQRASYRLIVLLL